jgi:tetratricopeptide (TPR) repeat protein
VERFFTPLLRRLYGLLAAFLLVYAGLQLLWRSEWHKERLYQQLVSGPRQGRFPAALTLADLSAQPQLLRALHSLSAPVRRTASSALWDLWYHAAGEDAFERVQVLLSALRFHDYSRALRVADQLVEKYPAYGEAWNRRATLLWLMGRYEESIADCRHVLALNPDQFAAWQGMGLCQLHVGDLRGALHSLRAARRLQPYDRSTQRLLDECQEYLRAHPRLPVHQADLTL